MLSWCWVFFLLFRIYALVTKPTLYATETIHGTSLSGGPSHQELALITSAPRVDRAVIQKRANVATCAYISGNAALPLTCPSGSTCTAGGFVNVGYSWACCDEIQCHGNYKQCVNYGDSLCPGLDDQYCSLIYTSILYCSSASPSCLSYARSSSLEDLRIQYSLACGSSNGIIPARYLPTSGKGEENGEQASITSGGISTPGRPSSSSQSADVRDNYSSSDPSLSTKSSPSDGSDQGVNSSTGNGLSRGEIAGIVVPVISVLVAVCFAWWKRHQVVWCVTCGRRGHKHTIRPPKRSSSVPYGNQLSTMPPRRDRDHPPIYGSQQFFIINGSNQQNLSSGR